MRNSVLKFCLFTLITISPLSIFSKTIYYIKPSSTGDQSGLSWANASNDLQKMIDMAQVGDEVWIAEGTYYPPEKSTYSWSLLPKDGVNIYGGFAGIETSIDERIKVDINSDGTIQPWEFQNAVIISGDLKKNDDPEDLDGYTFQDNCARVIETEGDTLFNETLLDGITISGGNSIYPNHLDGGGIFLCEKMTLSNSIISNNYAVNNGGGCINNGVIMNCYFYKNSCFQMGGALENHGKVESCSFEENKCNNNGSAIYNTGSVDNCTIRNNKNTSAIISSGIISGCTIEYNTSNYDGGGIYNLGTVINSQINNNSTTAAGGGVYNEENTKLIKCSIFNNSAGTGGGVFGKGLIDSCNILNNSASSQSGGIAGIFCNLTNCKISVNSALENGGGSLEGSTIINCTISKNKATEGVGGIVLTSSTIDKSSIFANEISHGNAGVFVNEYSTMKNCDIFLNKAKGLSIISAGVQNLGIVVNCRIFGNKTESQSTGAAGIWNGGILMNSVIYNNEANSSIQCIAGGVYSQGTMVNNTICNNKASLGAGNLGTYYGVYNCVIWGKDEQSSTAHFGMAENYHGEIKNCAVMDGNQISDGFDGNISLSRSNSGNENSKYPYFVNPTTFAGYPKTPEDSINMVEANWDISRLSALINKGYLDNPESLPDTCINGNKRISSTIDIGAYEFKLTISTNDPTSITISGATLNGTVLTADSSKIATYGFKYSEIKNFNPDTEGTETSYNQLSENKFIKNLEGLKEFTHYYYVAFLKDTSGIYEYGDQKSFFTKNDLTSREGIIYVTLHYSGSGDGSSWENATANLTEAITVSKPGNEIWIAKGIYRPNDLTPENTSNKQYFDLKNGVNYYGGFEGNETSIDDRKKTDNDQNGTVEAWEYSAQTILSADIDGIEDDYSNWPGEGKETTVNNAIHVLYQSYRTSRQTLVEGLILQGATSGGVTILSNTTLINCIVRRNTNNVPLTNGGGVNNDHGKVTSCLIDNNHITSTDNGLIIVSPGILTGGGIMNDGGVVSNCNIINCSVVGYGVQGGGIQNWYGVVDHCEVASNESSGNGGGIATYWGCVKNSKIYNNTSKNAALWAERNDTLINCVVFNNIASSGVGGADGWGSVHNVTSVNNIGNSSTIQNAGLNFYIENNCLTTGNFNKSFPNNKQPISSSHDFKKPSTFIGTAKTDAELILLETADWSLIGTSSFINKGNNSLVLSTLTTDIAGNKRIYGDKIDLGAYEFQGEPVSVIDQELINDKINVFQNNIQKRVEIYFEETDDYSVVLNDLTGRILYRANVKSCNKYFIDTSLNQKGIYIVEIIGKNKILATRKIYID
jgi:hypothetical protein